MKTLRQILFVAGLLSLAVQQAGAWTPYEKYGGWVRNFEVDKRFQFSNAGAWDNGNVDNGVSKVDFPGTIALSIMSWNNKCDDSDDHELDWIRVSLHNDVTKATVLLIDVDFIQGEYANSWWGDEYEKEGNVYGISNGCPSKFVQKRMYVNYCDGSQFCYFHVYYTEAIRQFIQNAGDKLKIRVETRWDDNKWHDYDWYSDYVPQANRTFLPTSLANPTITSKEWYVDGNTTRHRYSFSATDTYTNYRQSRYFSDTKSSWQGDWISASGNQTVSNSENAGLTVSRLNNDAIEYGIQLRRFWSCNNSYFLNKDPETVKYLYSGKITVIPPHLYYPLATPTVSDEGDGTMKISWNMKVATGETDECDFEMQRSENSDFSNVVNYDANKYSALKYDKNKTAYTLIDKTSARQRGNVTYYYRISRKHAKYECPLVQFQRVVNTNYKKISTFEASNAGSGKVKLSWTLTNGMWVDSELQYELTYNGETISPNNNDLSALIARPACTPTTFTLRLKHDGKVISEQTVSFMLPNDKEGQIEKLSVSKGFYSDRTLISWNISSTKDNFKYYVIKRCEVDDATKNYTTLGTLDHTLGVNSYRYEDMGGIPGTYYFYRVEGYQQCDVAVNVASMMESIGFSQPYGTVSGRITYAGSQAVPDVCVRAEGADIVKNRALYLQSVNKAIATIPLEVTRGFFTENAGSVQFWVKDMALGTDHAWLTQKNSIAFTLTGKELEFSINKGRSPNLAVSMKLDTCRLFNVDIYNHITATYASNDGINYQLVIYINGRQVISRTVQRQTTELINAELVNDMYIGRGYNDDFHANAYFDEIRFWNRTLSAVEVAQTYDRYLSGNENGLTAYYRCDENLPNDLFDISQTGNRYNECHATLTNVIREDVTVPNGEQLALKTYTDANGNYLLNNIPYVGAGALYSITPTLGVHEFDPNSRPLYFNSSANTHNGIDFTDISCFDVSGTVYYENTNYPVSDCNFYVDGTLCTKENTPIVSAVDGTFTISVPIGNHYITVAKDGHTFVNNGRYPADEKGIGQTETYTNPISGLTFYDNTLVTLTGRVAGGTIEQAKPHGLAQSKANIGQATILLFAGTSYQLNLDDTAGRIFDSPTERVQSVSTTGKYNEGSAAKTITITTDPKTGEFAVLVPPIDFAVAGISIPSNSDVTFAMESFSNINLSSINLRSVKVDSIKTDAGMQKFEYLYALDAIYRTSPTMEVSDAGNSVGAFGEAMYIYQNPATQERDTLALYTVENAIVNYTFGVPVFQQENRYKFNMYAYENYVNHDGTEPIEDKVPLANTVVTVANELGGQMVAIADGVNSETGENVAMGEIVNLASDQIQLDSLGQAVYSFKAGFPNIVAPYRLGLNITYNNNSKTEQWSGNGLFKGVVIGCLPTGSNFVTSGPDKVLFILRDPSGSNSSAYLEKGSTITNTSTMTQTCTSGNEVETVSHFGVETVVVTGLGVAIELETEAKADLTVGVNVNGSKSWNNEHTTTVTTTERFSTSDSPDMVGEDGDVFLGTATNIIFGAARQVAPKPNGSNYELTLDDAITTGTTFGTAFKYSQAYIENYLLPNLKAVRNALLIKVDPSVYNASYQNLTDKPIYITTLDPTTDEVQFGSNNFDKTIWGNRTTPRDSTGGASYLMILPTNRDGHTSYSDTIVWHNSQIRLWEELLAQNEEMKVKAFNDSKFLKQNHSFDAGAPYKGSITNCTSDIETIESSFEILAVLGIETGFSINSTGVDFSTKSTTGGGQTWSGSEAVETCRTVGYSFAEDGSDALSVDVFDAPDGFGPIFRTRGGQTSCPYEGEKKTRYFEPGQHTLQTATMQMEIPQIRVETNYVTDVPSGTAANYTLMLDNLSETGDDMWFDLKLLDSSNPNGAALTIDGATLTANGRQVLVKAGETLQKTIQLKQTRYDILNYENIGIVLASQCQADPTSVAEVIADTVWISAQFVPSCSPIELQIDNRTVNTESGDTLSIIVKNYDRTYANLKAIRIQYKGERDNTWTLAKEYVTDAADLDVSRGNELLNMAKINFRFPMKAPVIFDQTYQFRAITVCNFGSGEEYNESETITVVKDMEKPKVLGAPSPINGILTNDNEVYVLFNEAIQNGNLTNVNNFSVQGVLNGHNVAHSVALKLSGTEAVATEASIALDKRDFSVEMWLNYSVGGTLFAHGVGENNFIAKILDNDKLQVTIDGETYTSVNTLRKNTWMYLMLSYDYQETGSVLTVDYAYDAFTVHLFKGISVSDYDGIGRLYIGKNMQGMLHELTLWNIARNFTTAQSQMYTTKYPSTWNLIGYWPLDAGSGTIGLDNARSRNLVLPVNAWYLNNTNLAATFNGSAYLALNISTCPIMKAQDYALEFWFRGEEHAQESILFSAGDSLLIAGFAADNSMYLMADKVKFSLTNSNYRDGTWHHFALNVLRNGNSMIFIDGQSVLQLASTNIPALASDALVFGALKNGSSYSSYFKGQIDEVRIWRATMTADMLRLNRSSRLHGNEMGLVAYYPFEEVLLNVYQQQETHFTTEDKVSTYMAMAPVNVNVTVSQQAPALMEARSVENVSFGFTASDTKIVLNITEQADRIEGCTLEFRVKNVMDKNSNYSEPVMWTAYVNRNQLTWADEQLNIVKEELVEKQFTAVISNQSGNTESWTIKNLPTWLSVNKQQGTLAALSTETLQFTIDASTPIGTYEETLYLTGNNNIDAPLVVNLKVMAKKPDFVVDPANFEMSMNLIGVVKIDNILTEDSEDLIAAYIGQTCVGIASPKYFSQYGTYYLMMTIYGNAEDVDAPVIFKIWDASTGRIYPSVTTSVALKFKEGLLAGTLAIPIELNALDVIEQQITLTKGWNWISFNVEANNMTPNSLLAPVVSNTILLKAKEDGFVQNQNGNLVGNLNVLNVESMYKTKMSKACQLNIVGNIISPAENEISILSGWNWIGFIPQNSMLPKTALADYDATIGDIIKSRTQFAVYDGSEWVGTFDYMAPGNGYMLFSNNTVTQHFVYPVASTVNSRNIRKSITAGTYFNPNTASYSGNMTMVARVQDGDEILTNVEVGVFADSICRGTSLVSATDSLFYITIAGDEQQVPLQFHVYHIVNGVQQIIDQKLVYADDAIYGLETPYIIQLSPTALQNPYANSISVYPTRVDDILNVTSDNVTIKKISIQDVSGRTIVCNSYGQANKKMSIQFNVSDFAQGVYMVIVTTEDGEMVQKIVK